MDRTTTLTTDDLVAVVTRYLGALERYSLDETADCFTDDVFYSHPPYSNDDGRLRHEVEGREALLALFGRRGKRSVTHRVETAVLDGRSGFVAGTFDVDGETTGSFVSAVTLAPDGRIARYASYSSVPPVGAALGQ